MVAPSPPGPLGALLASAGQGLSGRVRVGVEADVGARLPRENPGPHFLALQPGEPPVRCVQGHPPCMTTKRLPCRGGVRRATPGKHRAPQAAEAGAGAEKQAWAPLRLQDLAQPFGLSVPHFARLWTRAVKTPVSWYVVGGGRAGAAPRARAQPSTHTG